MCPEIDDTARQGQKTGTEAQNTDQNIKVTLD